MSTDLPLTPDPPGGDGQDVRSALQSEAIYLAQLAVNFDRSQDLEAAVYYYQESAHLLDKCLAIDPSAAELVAKRDQYSARAQALLDRLTKSAERCQLNRQNSQEVSKLLRAECLLKEALDDDQELNYESALELYTQAIELCIEAKNETNDDSLKKKLTQLASSALDRAEALKRNGQPVAKTSPTHPKTTSSPQSDCDINKALRDVRLESRSSSATQPTAGSPVSAQQPKHVVSGQSTYTREEIAVLRTTSVINGREYVPFLSVDLRERFSYPMPFTDKDGLLVLAPKQKVNLNGWRRLDELSPNPSVISESVDCFSIKQTVVSDCSFVASLAVSALFEKRFNKRIITSIIYPQRRDGRPVYNPCGKYMVKFNINGVSRKVIIDDRLPFGRNGELMCSYSSNKNEFWVSLLEKAYMKVMGGYDFPGSNSNIDLHALTGWIPERVSLTGADSAERDKTFRMLCDRHSKGDVLITVATGELSDNEAERTGLVPTHAYAVLDVRQVANKRLFLLKNPWSHLRWKGNYSERDITHWTQQLKDALKYEPQNARNFDNGVFWIDIDSIYQLYDVFYLNWNPSLFKYTYCTHDSWSAGVGPAKDLYYIGDNPQYSLTLSSPDSTAWILLTRHITDRNDFANNKEYIALLVYKNGEKVYMPFDPPPYIDGVRINSPHYLCKIVAKESNTCLKYTLVISQYEKSQTIHYTLRAYSTAPFQLKKLVSPYKFKEVEKSGKWTAETAGGCLNNRDTYHKNPVYQLTITGANDADNQILIDLKGPKDFPIGLDLTTVSVLNQSSANYFKHKTSGSFRTGFTILQAKSVPAGTYNIIPSTYRPNQIGPFFLVVHSTTPIKLVKLR